MNLSFNQYRAIDLTIMAVLLAISEALITIAATKWFPITAFYMVSPMVAMTCIVMMRWSGFAVIHAALGGLVYCMVLGASAEQYAIYMAGNCGVLIALLVLKFAGKKKVAESGFLTVIYVAAAYVGAQLGRWLIGLMLGGNIEDIIRYLTTDSISLLFSIIVVLISRKPDGLFEDQRAYLIRIDEERREEQRLHDHDDFAD